MRTQDIQVDRPKPGTAVIHAPSRLDSYTAPALRELSVQLVADGRYRLVADLTHTTTADTTGLAVLVGIHKRCRGYGGRLVLLAPTERVSSLLRLTGTVRVFTIVETLEGAFMALDDAPAPRPSGAST